MELMKRLLQEEDGQAVIEYILIVAMISIIAIAAVGAVGVQTNEVWAGVDEKFLLP